MKKIFTLTVLLSVISIGSFAQSVVLLSNDFTGYTGTVGTVATNWYYSWNDSINKSYYTSAGNFGATPPSYKFGRDSVTIITPRIDGSPDSVSFWMKGNGSTTSIFSLQNSLSIYESTDSTNWTLNTVIDSLVATVNGSTDSFTVKFPLNAATAYLKFYYQKFVGNIGMDDLTITGIYNGIPTQLNTQKSFSVYPNPSNGLISVDFGPHGQKGLITINNVLGMQIKKTYIRSNETIYQFDLSNFPDGVYFIKVSSDAGETTHRILLRK